MTNNMTPIDFSISEDELRQTDIWLENCYSCENNYKSHNWNREITRKYVFQDSHGIYEAGFFQHYMDETFVKAVIELPVGFGCPSRCRYCASAGIDNFYPMSDRQMKLIFEQLYWENNLDKVGTVLLSITGMGDLYFNQENVFAFLGTLQGYTNLSLTLSSNFWTEALLEKAVSVNDYLPIRYIQYTYVSDIQNVRENLINILEFMEKKEFLDDFISFVKRSDKSFFRINYIVISGINDSQDDVDRFISCVDEIKGKLTVRISQLNETEATRKNQIFPSDHVRMGEINERMKNEGIRSYIFYSEKNDNMNCGQLITEYKYVSFPKKQT